MSKLCALRLNRIYFNVEDNQLLINESVGKQVQRVFHVLQMKEHKVATFLNPTQMVSMDFQTFKSLLKTVYFLALETKMYDLVGMYLQGMNISASHLKLLKFYEACSLTEGSPK